MRYREILNKTEFDITIIFNFDLIPIGHKIFNMIDSNHFHMLEHLWFRGQNYISQHKLLSRPKVWSCLFLVFELILVIWCLLLFSFCNFTF